MRTFLKRLQCAEVETGMAENSSWDQANRWQKLGLVWRNRKKISQIVKDYVYLPFFLLIILWQRTTTTGSVEKECRLCNCFEPNAENYFTVYTVMEILMRRGKIFLCIYVTAYRDQICVWEENIFGRKILYSHFFGRIWRQLDINKTI